MERKIGFAPIPCSGKEPVLSVELLPHITWRRQPDLNR
jgi:hypothetical protein